MARHRLQMVVGVFIIGAAASAALRATPQESAPATAQSTAPAAATKAFDVASVRANRSGTTQTRTNRTPTGVTIINQTLRPIIQLAYGIDPASPLRATLPPHLSRRLKD